ncbi:GNAT family N-acetyltransferase [Paenibacillus sp. CAA11]|uniref:GNAT family N-acetyltransferase n=1 Tax=Paenibacillus sp. CAA11 TaxID=1532905 RepID=UPI000D336F42|nr:GNAT family N-acetyltransferase [Paenibacillus sp. CAA11]AWB44522.1 GNAT family N-acetyltransferase [Paenibacillus sp. CAA11]
MREVTYRELAAGEEAPMELLLLADPSEKLVRKYLDEGQCIIAELDNELIGEFVLLPRADHTLEIINVAVREQWQGQGYGKQLVKQAILMAKQRNMKCIEIGTGNSSLNQLRLYQRCGFEVYTVIRNFFVDHYEEEIIEDGIPCKHMIRLRMQLEEE